jgi:phage N-6-adenine-methyltransferase
MSGGFAQAPLVSTTAHGVEGARDDWETPDWLFDVLDKEFRFGIDCAASERTTKVPSFYISEEDDALRPEKEWGLGAATDSAWLNPPYGRGVGDWVEKAYLESRKGLTVVVLLFARTDTKWWHEYAMKAAEIRFIKGRLRFLQDGEQRGTAAAPSCVLVFTPWSEGPPAIRTIERPR